MATPRAVSPTRRISNETLTHVDHRVSVLDPLHDVPPDGRHRPRDGAHYAALFTRAHTAASHSAFWRGPDRAAVGATTVKVIALASLIMPRAWPVVIATTLSTAVACRPKPDNASNGQRLAGAVQALAYPTAPRGIAKLFYESVNRPVLPRSAPNCLPF